MLPRMRECLVARKMVVLASQKEHKRERLKD